MNKEKTMGQVGYEAYGESSSGKSLISGQPLPDWEDLKTTIQDAWEHSADAVINTYLEHQESK